MGKYDEYSSQPEPERHTVEEPRAAPKYGPGAAVAAPVTAPPGRTWMDTLKGYGQTADDAVRAAANAITFGMADRLAGYTSGTGTDEQVRLSEEARRRSPYASIAGDVGGAVMLPGIGGRQLAARYGGGLGARALGYGGEGALLGAAQGAGTTYTGKPLDYITNAATSGAMGGVLGAGAGSLFGARGGMRSSAETPSTDRLFREKTANYQQLERSPARYEPQYLSQAADIAENRLMLDRYHPSRSPVTWQALDEMRGAPTAFPTGQAPISPGDIEFIRKGLNQINRVADPTDANSARVVKRALDDFVLNPPQGAVLPGTEAAAREASALAERARGNYGGYRRGEAIDDLIENARTQAGSTHSGLNVANNLRQGVRSFVRQTKGESPASKAGFNDDEIAALTRFARVPFGDASLRYIDRILGGGGGLGALAAGGVGGGVAGQYLQNNPTWGTAAGFAIPAAGLGLRALGNRRANQQINELGDLIRQRTPLYQERAAAAPMVLPPGGANAARVRDALTTELIKQGYGQVDEGEPRMRITVTPDYERLRREQEQ